jgi:hypothetical protein
MIHKKQKRTETFCCNAVFPFGDCCYDKGLFLRVREVAKIDSQRRRVCPASVCMEEVGCRWTEFCENVSGGEFY